MKKRSYRDWLTTERWQGAESSYFEAPKAALGDADLKDQSSAKAKNDITSWKNLYRHFGHYRANLSALEGLVGDDWDRGQYWMQAKHMLSLEGDAPEDLDAIFSAYTQSIGYELSQIRDLEAQLWWFNAIESYDVPSEKHEARLKKAQTHLEKAYAFEHYLHTKYVGQKRFSLEGMESLLPAVLFLFEHFEALNYDYLALGATHRGRLNLMANAMGLGWASVNDLFEYRLMLPNAGDVKYHLGCQGQYGNMKLEMFPNPSHLESVGPVVMGAVRALQDQKKKAAAIVLHGDGAFAAQGVISECFNLRRLAHYDLQGVIHIVCNNHIGFTTQPEQARSTLYVTDSIRGQGCPILHVNGQDLSAVMKAIELAVAYKEIYRQDVIIDLQGMRRHGHNEADEPRITQPLMTKEVMKYALSIKPELLAGIITSEIDNAPQRTLSDFSIAQSRASKEYHRDGSKIYQLWLTLKARLEKITLHSVVLETYKDREAMFSGEKPMQWAAAEAHALLRIVESGSHIRLMGQDAERGTFSQRHAVVVDQKSSESLMCYDLPGYEGRVSIGNSPLSEYAALGFEFGYALKQTSGLVVWEAQFGDFANGAQIIIDQYLVASAERWGLENNLVLLLPHGYEGQGSEHSSARIERFLQLTGNNNIRLVMPSTPCQYHHALLKASLDSRPWVIFTPKSLLRHPACVSPVLELMSSDWKDLIVLGDLALATHIILASGRIIYDVLSDPRFTHHAILCIESLYPFPEDELRLMLLKAVLKKYVVYCQDEPENQGAYPEIKDCLRRLCPEIRAVYRARSPIPATGYLKTHNAERISLLDQIFGASCE